MTTTTLSNEPALPGCTVFDIVYGYGEITSVDGCRIGVSFGSAGRPRTYNQSGVTGKNCQRTLFWHPPIIVELPKDECNAGKLKCAFEGFMKIAADLLKIKPCEPAPDCNTCCDPNPCDKYSGCGH